MSKVHVDRIHPTRNPNHCVISGVREGGELGFWVGPDIDVTGSQIITPHVSIRMAKQWLEAANLVVDKSVQVALSNEVADKELEIENLKRQNEQLKKRLTRVFPGRPRKDKVPA